MKAKITKDLKFTLQRNPQIKTVYFDKFGNHYFNAHKEVIYDEDGTKTATGKLFHRITDQNVTEVKEVNGKSVQKKGRRYIAHPDHELVTQLSAVDVLASPIEITPEFADKNAAEIYEKQAQEAAKLRAELDDLRKQAEETKALKEELERLKEEKATLETPIGETPAETIEQPGDKEAKTKKAK